MLFLLFWACAEQNYSCILYPYSDTWQQAPNEQVDILFALDASDSMVERQTLLAEGFSSFIAPLEAYQTDFHLGVITTSFLETDPERGKLLGDPPFLTLEDDYTTLFPERIQLGSDGSQRQRGLEAALYTLTANENSDFLRQEAALRVIFISDKGDCSDEGALEGNTLEDCTLNPDLLIPIADYVYEFRSLKDDHSQVSLDIIGIEAEEGDLLTERYEEASFLAGGLAKNILAPDWGNLLSEIGLETAGIRSRFPLNCAAVPETLEVSVTDEKTVLNVSNNPIDGFVYYPEAIYLDFYGTAIPPEGSTISVSYESIPGTCY